jgi:hypothetical protein
LELAHHNGGTVTPKNFNQLGREHWWGAPTRTLDAVMGHISDGGPCL